MKVLTRTVCFTVLFVQMIALCQPVAASDTCHKALRLYQKGLDLMDGSIQEAIYYEKAISLCPSLYDAYIRLGRVYILQGRLEDAAKIFQQAIAINDKAEAHLWLSRIYRIKGLLHDALVEVEHALSIDPENLEANNQLEYLKKRLGIYDKTIEPLPSRLPMAIFARIPGMTLPKGAILADLQYNFLVQDCRMDTPAQERTLKIHSWILGLRYGLTERLTLGLMPRFHDKKLRLFIPELGHHISPQVKGIGDTNFLIKLRLFKRGRTSFSAYHLLSIPTGDSSATGSSHRVKRILPLGSGHLDFQPGLTFTMAKGPFTLHSSVSYLVTGSKNTGDELHINLAITSKLTNWLTTTMEINHRWRGSSHRVQIYQTRLKWPYGEPDEHRIVIEEKSGHTVFFSPGIRLFVPQGFQIEIGAKVPILRPGIRSGTLERTVFHIGIVKAIF